jgi:hypothetical protein
VKPIKDMFARGGFTVTGETKPYPNRTELRWVKTDKLSKEWVAEQKADTIAANAPSVAIAPKKKRVLIGCSAKQGIPSYWEKTITRLMKDGHPDYDFDFEPENGNAAINITRNLIADKAIREGYWKVAMIDTDHLWSCEQLFRLLGHNEDIVGGIYCKKRKGPPSWVVVKTPGVPLRDDGLLQADFIGTGFLVTKVSALKFMAERLPEREFTYDDEDHLAQVMTELFPIGLVGPNTPSGKLERIRRAVRDVPSETLIATIKAILEDKTRGGARMLGEDYHFGLMARNCGLRIYADTKVIVGHVGPIVFPVEADSVATPTEILTHNLSLEPW